MTVTTKNRCLFSIIILGVCVLEYAIFYNIPVKALTSLVVATVLITHGLYYYSEE